MTLDREDEQAYLFKHVVTQEVAYESMPFAIRADLHERVGGYIEATHAEALERNLDLLAHHYWLSENVDKKREYLVRAGDAAKASFANAAAIDYFERAIPLLDGEERWHVTRALGDVLEGIGDPERAEAAYREALTLAEEADDASSAGWTETSLAELDRKRGDFDAAAVWLRAAEGHFGTVGDRPGFGRVEHIRGILANIGGDRAAARRHMEASLEIRQETGDAVAMGALYSNLAIVAEYEGDYEASVALHEQGLAIRREAGDVAGIAVSQMNLGVMLQRLGRYDEARARQEESLQLRREIGDPRMIALGEHNLGILTRELGDYAETRRLFAGALRVQRDQGDKWALAFMLEDVAVLATLLGRARARAAARGCGRRAPRGDGVAARGVAAQEELERSARAVARGARGARRGGLGRGAGARARRGDPPGARVLRRRVSRRRSSSSPALVFVPSAS